MNDENMLPLKIKDFIDSNSTSIFKLLNAVIANEVSAMMRTEFFSRLSARDSYAYIIGTLFISLQKFTLEIFGKSQIISLEHVPLKENKIKIIDFLEKTFSEHIFLINGMSEDIIKDAREIIEKERLK